jgi:hypothetical protein
MIEEDNEREKWKTFRKKETIYDNRGEKHKMKEETEIEAILLGKRSSGLEI